MSFQLDERWIADSLSLLQSEKHRTPYVGIKKLVPGNKLTYNDELKITPYWVLKPESELSHLNFESAVQLFFEKFNQAVERRVKGYHVLGSELSGGLDSSGVTAIVNLNLMNDGQSLYALSHALLKSMSRTDFLIRMS